MQDYFHLDLVALDLVFDFIQPLVKNIKVVEDLKFYQLNFKDENGFCHTDLN